MRALALVAEHPSGYAAWQLVTGLLEDGHLEWVPRAASIFLEQSRTSSDPAYTAYHYKDMMDRMKEARFPVPDELLSVGLSHCFRTPDLPAQLEYLSTIAWALIEGGQWEKVHPILDHMIDSKSKGRIAARVAWELVNAGRADGLERSGLLDAARRDPRSLAYLYEFALSRKHNALAESLLPTLIDSEEATITLLSSVLDKLGPQELEEMLTGGFHK